jgi:hypothetical protein
MKDRFHGNFKPFTKDQKVWLESKNLATLYLSKKIAPKREGPFKIKEILSPVTYRLDLPERWKIHDVFHASLLTPFVETEAHGPSFPNLPPDIIDGEEEYKVEQILASRKFGSITKYLVRWKGYSSYHDSWQREEDMGNCKNLWQNSRRKGRKDYPGKGNQNGDSQGQLETIKSGVYSTIQNNQLFYFLTYPIQLPPPPTPLSPTMSTFNACPYADSRHFPATDGGLRTALTRKEVLKAENDIDAITSPSALRYYVSKNVHLRRRT